MWQISGVNLERNKVRCVLEYIIDSEDKNCNTGKLSGQLLQVDLSSNA